MILALETASHAWCEKNEPANKTLLCLWATIHLAQEVGAELGGCEVLQRCLPGEWETQIIMTDLRRSFISRDEMIEYVRTTFADSAEVADVVSSTPGGRAAAEAALRQIAPQRYAATRNRLDGAVTRLSMYIRHGVLGLAEVRDAVISMVGSRHEAEKLINELAWRDYWQRLYRELGEGIWVDREAYKTGYMATQYQNELPNDIPASSTGLACMDAFSRELRETGYLHNHVRMWLAAYVVHWRRVKWQAGAHWFLMHLLDGDPASNNLSWQWVASTFSYKPYIFNRENLERYSGGLYCRDCPLRGKCDFEGSYEDIRARLFPNVPEEVTSGW